MIDEPLKINKSYLVKSLTKENEWYLFTSSGREIRIGIITTYRGIKELKVDLQIDWGLRNDIKKLLINYG